MDITRLTGPTLYGTKLMNMRYALWLVALKIHLLERIMDQRREYMSEEFADTLGNEPWATDDAHELETWSHRHNQPRSITLNY